MKIPFSLFLACQLLLTGFSCSGQEKLSPTTQASPTLVNDQKIEKEILKIQNRLTQIAQEMDVVGARMTQGIASPTPDDSDKVVRKVHELLTQQSPGETIKNFLDSTRDEFKWEMCLKSAKLYMGILDLIFPLEKELRTDSRKNQWPVGMTDEFSPIFQLSFLARMITEEELRSAELESPSKSKSDEKQHKLWRVLRDSLQNDDQTYLVKWKSFLMKNGIPPAEFAARLLDDARKISPSAAANVAEGMHIVDPAHDLWRLAEIPGINPGFIQFLECDQRNLRDYLTTNSIAALIRSLSCGDSSDGSSIQVIFTKPASQPTVPDQAGKTPANPDEEQHGPLIIRLPQEDPFRDLPNFKKGASQAESGTQKGEDSSAAFGGTFTARPQEKIPAGWIRCECPSDHPNAGRLFEGIRWHAPVLQCPNPELRRLEVK